MTEEQQTAHSGRSWDDLANQAISGMQGQGALVEASRRVVMTQEVSERSATLLGQRIERLNWWLLAFTVAICVLTVVLLLVELGVLRRPHEQATSTAWVLWQSTISPSGEENWLINFAFSREEGGKSMCEDARSKREKELKTQVETDYKKTGKAYFYSLTCLPDTVDPRAPKGK